MKPEPMLYADSARGIYIPQHFAETIHRGSIEGVAMADLSTLAAGPDGNSYWDTWSDILDNAVITYGGTTYRLYQDGDLWLIPDSLTWNDETEWFE